MYVEKQELRAGIVLLILLRERKRYITTKLAKRGEASIIRSYYNLKVISSRSKCD